MKTENAEYMRQWNYKLADIRRTIRRTCL